MIRFSQFNCKKIVVSIDKLTYKMGSDQLKGQIPQQLLKVIKVLDGPSILANKYA